MADFDNLKGKAFGSDNDDEEKISLVEEASRQLMTEYHFMTIEETDDIFYYKDGVYVAGGDKLIATEAERMFGYDLHNSHLAEIKGHIMRRHIRQTRSNRFRY